MSLKHILVSFLILVFSILSVHGQTALNISQEEESIIDISPAELQSLVEELMQLKKKRMLYLAAQQQQRTNINRQSISKRTDNQNNTSTTDNHNVTREEKALNQRVTEMEQMLVDIKQQLNRIERKNPEYVETSVSNQIEKRDLDDLQGELKDEINELKKTIRTMSTNPSSTTVINGRDTIYIQKDTEYLKEYATQMMELRDLVRDMERQLAYVPTRTDYDNLQKHLDKIEEKIVSPIIVKTEGQNNTNTDQITETVSNAVLASQLSDLRKLVKDLSSSSKVAPPVNAPTPTTNNDALIAEFNAKFEELRGLITDIKRDPIIQRQPEVKIIKEKVVTTVPTKPHPTTAIPSTPVHDPLEAIVTSNKKQLLFYANNAFDTNSTHKMALQKTITLMQQHPSLNLSINGYSSPQGSAVYNQKLSQKRAEAAKMYLIQNGISSNRILTDSLGVDYNSSDAAQARRVELVLLLPR